MVQITEASQLGPRRDVEGVSMEQTAPGQTGQKFNHYLDPQKRIFMTHCIEHMKVQREEDHNFPSSILFSNLLSKEMTSFSC